MDGLFVSPPSVLKLVSHEVRWNLLQLLAHSDYRVHDLVEQLKLPQNLVSYHLKQLRQEHLVADRRSSADERSVFYSLDVEQLHVRYLAAAEQLHPALTAPVTEPGLQEDMGFRLHCASSFSVLRTAPAPKWRKRSRAI